MSDYLWDKEGAPDPEVEELEQLLAPLAFDRPPPVLPPAPRRLPRAVFLGAGAVALAALIALLWLRPGRWIETGASGRTLQLAALGTVELGANTRARMVESGDGRSRMELERGTLTARIDAAPRRFVVETRYVRAIDLGCAFTLSVDESGRGRLVVSAGRVALADGSQREVVVPAGSESGFSERGPGVAFSSDAGAGFRAALARYEQDPSALPALLAELRPADRATLTQLLFRASDAERPLLQARLAELDAPRPPAAPAPQMAPPKPDAAPQKNVRSKPRLNAAPQKNPTAAPQKNPLPTKTTPPAPPKRPAPDSRFSHDALKDLDRSLP